MTNYCAQPQAHPDRCGCEPDAFQIARHSKRLVEQQRERIADLEDDYKDAVADAMDVARKLREVESERDTLRQQLADYAALEAECTQLQSAIVSMIDLAHEYRHLLTQQRFPDNDEGDAFRRHRDAQVARIERILSAACAAKVKSHE